MSDRIIRNIQEANLETRRHAAGQTQMKLGGSEDAAGPETPAAPLAFLSWPAAYPCAKRDSTDADGLVDGWEVGREGGREGGREWCKFGAYQRGGNTYW